MTPDNTPISRQIRCNATELSVRKMLVKLRQQYRDMGLNEDTCSSVEIAVAEALNNIVGHACANQPDAVICLDLSRDATHVFVQVQDPGVALPGWNLPEGRRPNLEVARDDLPEGGFGWGLIHMVSDRLGYSRIDGQNRLKMWIALHPNNA